MSEKRPAGENQGANVLGAFQLHQLSLKRFIGRYLNNAQDIEDVTQEAFLRAYKAEQTTCVQQPKSFLFRIAKNVAISQLRTKSRRITDYIEDQASDDVLISEWSTEDQVMAEQKLGIHCEAVAALPPKCRRVYLLLDGAGFRAQSMLDAVEGAPSIGHTLSLAQASGTAPTIGVVMGACAGESALNAALAEYSIMVKGTGMIAAGGPPVVKASTGVDVTKEELGGVSVHAEITGMIDNVVESDEEAITTVKKLLSYLPTNAWAYPPSSTGTKAKEGAKVLISKILPEHPRKPYNMQDVIDCVVDDKSFLETKAAYGQALITGFARLNGHPVGIIANQPSVRAGAIGGAEAQKARKFIDYCGAYHLPVISLADTPGVMTGPAAERQGSLKYGLGAAYALAWANVPVFSVVLRKAFGFGGALMAGSAGPQAVALAWPTADFSSLPPDSAIESAHKKELDAAEDREALYAELMKQYQTFGGPYPAAGVMNIDDVVAPEETRERLIQALETTMARRTQAPEPNLRAGVMP